MKVQTKGKRQKGVARPGTEPSIESFIRAGDIHFPAEKAPPFFYPDRAALDEAIARGNVPRDGKGRPLLRADLPRLEFWVGKPIAHGRLSRIVRKTASDEEARRPVGSWIAGLGETVTDAETQTLRSDRQGVATAEIERLFGAQVFSYPKPLSLIKALVRATAGEGDLVLDFFAGSGTTGAAVMALNADDDADRRFILVSSSEATTAEPDKNLCRDVCAARLEKITAGHGNDEPVAGDFAYLRTRRLRWDDVIYELDDAQTWTLLQLRQARPLRPFDTSAAIQLAPPEAGSAEPTVAYVTSVTADTVQELRRLAASGPVIAFSPAPALLRDAIALPAVPIEQVPGVLLSAFPRLIAGL